MKRFATLISAFVLFLALTSCASKYRSSSYFAERSQAVQLGSQEIDDYGALVSLEPMAVEARKVVYSANLNLTVDEVDAANDRLGEIAKKHGGFLSNSGSYSTVLRVKSENLKTALADIETLGKVERKRLSGQDVTDEYLDHQIRLDNAQKARKRYLELLAKAENVEAALLVEKELERLNGTIDMLKGKMNRLDQLEKYSTITVFLSERKKPGILGYIGLGLYHSVKWLFVRN